MLIVDMKMPKRCFDCPMHDWTYGQHETRQNLLVCNARHELEPILSREIPNGDERPEWCPIKGELVRCRECKHRDPEDKRCDCGGHEWVKGKILPVKDDWFCADGERKYGERDV